MGDGVMPVVKRGKFWYMGSKRFTSKAAAERAYAAYRAKKYGNKRPKKA